jgi:predicted HicB family RNase H-like nuclease
MTLRLTSALAILRKARMHVRVRPSVKAAAQRLAQEDGRSLANWLERLIEAEAARRDGKK